MISKILVYCSLLLMLVATAQARIYPGQTLGHDVTFQLVNADLTSNGVQYDTVHSTATAGVDSIIIVKSIDFNFGDTATFKPMIDCYFDFIVEFKADGSATADVSWKAQARDKNGTWADLFSYVTYADIGTSYVAKEYKGYSKLPSTFDQVPCDVRILFRCDEDDEGRARLKSGSYVRVIFLDQ